MDEPPQDELRETHLAEYQSLVGYIISRRSVQMTTNVIAMAGTAGILGIIVGQAKMIGPVAAWAALIPIPLMAVAWINWRALKLLDDATWDRVQFLEKHLSITAENPPGYWVGGHTGIHSSVRRRWLSKIRNISWDMFYIAFLLISFYLSGYLFWPNLWEILAAVVSIVGVGLARVVVYYDERLKRTSASPNS